MDTKLIKKWIEEFTTVGMEEEVIIVWPYGQPLKRDRDLLSECKHLQFWGPLDDSLKPTTFVALDEFTEEAWYACNLIIKKGHTKNLPPNWVPKAQHEHYYVYRYEPPAGPTLKILRQWLEHENNTNIVWHYELIERITPIHHRKELSLRKSIYSGVVDFPISETRNYPPDEVAWIKDYCKWRQDSTDMPFRNIEWINLISRKDLVGLLMNLRRNMTIHGKLYESLGVVPMNMKYLDEDSHFMPELELINHRGFLVLPNVENQMGMDMDSRNMAGHIKLRNPDWSLTKDIEDMDKILAGLDMLPLSPDEYQKYMSGWDA